MPNRVNYQLAMEKVLAELEAGGRRPRLLLHACCAPCSSATLERLAAHFDLTVLYYNPNIYPPAEYRRREAELERFVQQAGYRFPVVELPYDPQEFYDAVRGLEQEPEKGARCTACYRLRLEQAARYAAEQGFEWYCTTLSISPMKDPVRINTLGAELGARYGVRFLPSEFRKKDGYKRSLQLSAEYGLYRQDYCGCVFSKQARGAEKPPEGGTDMTEKHILVALPLSAGQRERIRQAAPGFACRFTTEETATLEEVLWADAILGNVPVELIRQNRRLAWFQSNFAGPDPYLEPGVLPPDCLVTNATGAYGLAISEWMLGMWLALAKDLLLYRDRQRRQCWQAIERPVRSVAGSRVLCVGMGDIGASFARRAHALGAEVVGVRRHAAPAPDYCLRVVGAEELDAELPGADVVALSLPGTPETARLFDAARLARCKPGAILINVGRGTAVDSDALAAAIESGALYGAALDVTDPEPLPPEHPLWRLDTVLITPHISGRFSLPRTLENIVGIFAHNLRRFASGQTLDNQMSRRTRYVSAEMPGRRLTCEAEAPAQ